MENFSDFVRDLQSKLECPSCGMSYRSPKLSTRCAHIACYECFINLVCPVCQKPTSEADLKDEKRLRDAIAVLRTLRIQLPQHENVSKVDSTSARSNPSNSEPRASLQTSLGSTPQASARNARASATQASASRIDKKNRHGETVLHVACKKKGNIDRVRELLAQGANPNTQDHAGWSPLHEVTHTGDLEIAKALLANGANVNIKASCGTSPLHDAIGVGYLEMIKLLLEHGADPKAENTDGKTPLQLSEYNEHVNELVKSVKPLPAAAAPPTASVDAGTKFLIMSSSLKEPQIESLNEFLKIINAQSTAYFTPDVTHLVVNCDSKGDTQRTLKYLQFLASRKFIVSYQWIEQCVKARAPVSELPFEVKGCRQFSALEAPRRAREAAAANQPGLLSGFSVFFAQLDRNFVPTTDNLVQLTELAGGTVLKRHPKTLPQDELSREADPSPHVKAMSIFEKHRYLVVGLRNELSQNILHVTRDWLIDSISNFELLDLLF